MKKDRKTLRCSKPLRIMSRGKVDCEKAHTSSHCVEKQLVWSNLGDKSGGNPVLEHGRVTPNPENFYLQFIINP